MMSSLHWTHITKVMFDALIQKCKNSVTITDNIFISYYHRYVDILVHVVVDTFYVIGEACIYFET